MKSWIKVYKNVYICDIRWYNQEVNLKSQYLMLLSDWNPIMSASQTEYWISRTFAYQFIFGLT